MSRKSRVDANNKVPDVAEPMALLKREHEKQNASNWRQADRQPDTEAKTKAKTELSKLTYNTHPETRRMEAHRQCARERERETDRQK